MKKKILIFGTGGHAKVVFDAVQKSNDYETFAFVSLSENLTEFKNTPHFHQSQLKEIACDLGVVAIGDNSLREKAVQFIKSQKPNFQFVSIIHPQAIIANGVEIGEGSVVFAGACINADSKVGQHVIINTKASVDHDCVLQHFSSVAPGATLGGNVTLGASSVISLGANVIQNIQVGEQCVIGAGAVVVEDIGSFKVAFGNPCRVIRSRQVGDKYL